MSEQATGKRRNGGWPAGAAAWLSTPLNLPTRAAWGWAAGLAAVLVGWSAWRDREMSWAWNLPDVRFYGLLAQERFSEVPAPFSQRPLAPLLARGIAALVHGTVWTGFAVLAAACLAVTSVLVLWQLLRGSAPRWLLPAVVAVAFWPSMMGYAGLPDPLYAALLAVLLLLLAQNRSLLPAGMMLPLMLAREATWLVLACLLVSGWRRMRWQGSVLAVAAAGMGAWLVHRVSAKGLPNPEQLSGGPYLLGKVAANSLRTLGVMPWSNVYPYLCDPPRWSMAVGHWGPVRTVGLCAWNPVEPLQAVWALLTTFGIFPVLAVVCWRRWWPAWRSGDPCTRFCLLYGGVSLALAPTLGTWYLRLVGYGWPLLLVAVPRLLRGGGAGLVVPRAPLAVGALLLIQAALTGLGIRPQTPVALGTVIGLQACALATLFWANEPPGRVPKAAVPQPPAW